MSEFIGLGYYAEIPTVVFDVERWDPPPGCRRVPCKAISFRMRSFHMAIRAIR